MTSYFAVCDACRYALEMFEESPTEAAGWDVSCVIETKGGGWAGLSIMAAVITEHRLCGKAGTLAVRVVCEDDIPDGYEKQFAGYHVPNAYGRMTLRPGKAGR